MRKFKLLVLILILVLTPSVFASTNTENRNNLKNYGVNKHWKITESNKSNVLNTYKVNADEKIYDFADILTDEEEKQAYEKFKAFINKTHMDMVFVTINMPYTSDSQIEDFAADFYDYNDFGIDFENYSGVLLVRNTYEADPFYNLYLFGNAQLYFYGSRTENTLDNIYNSFHSGYYMQGLNTFVSNFNYYYDLGIDSSLKYKRVDKDGRIYEELHIPWGGIILADVILVLIILLILIKKNHMVKKKLNINDYVNNKNVNFTKKNDIFVSEHVSSYTTSSSSGGGHSGGGFHSSGGSSGGFHSSGGGRHG